MICFRLASGSSGFILHPFTGPNAEIKGSTFRFLCLWVAWNAKICQRPLSTGLRWIACDLGIVRAYLLDSAAGGISLVLDVGLV